MWGTKRGFGMAMGQSLVAAVLAVVAGTAFSADLATYELAVKQGRFSPETIEVQAGQKFKLHVKNEGPGAEEFESSDLNREKVIPAGRSAEVIIGPLAPGQYKFIGEFHPDTARGRIIAK